MLLGSQSFVTVCEYYHYLNKLLMLYQSTSLTLKLDFYGNTISLFLMIPRHKVDTIELMHKDEKEVKSQWIYKIYARFAFSF